MIAMLAAPGMGCVGANCTESGNSFNMTNAASLNASVVVENPIGSNATPMTSSTNETPVVSNSTAVNTATVVVNTTSDSTIKTYEDLTAFLANDTTEKTPRTNINIPAPEYATNLLTNAKAAGFNVSAETVSFQGGCPVDRTFVLFQTSDKGQIIIDDTGTMDGTAVDKIVTKCEVGQRLESSAFGGDCTQQYKRGIVSAITPIEVENSTTTQVVTV